MTATRTQMGWETREPCASCPYRKDAPLRLWHRSEFENLLRQDANEFGGAIFGCHGTRKLPQQQICGGWLLNQKRRNIPSIQLRLSLISSKAAREALRLVSDGGHELYGSIAAMCRANGVRHG